MIGSSLNCGSSQSDAIEDLNTKINELEAKIKIMAKEKVELLGKIENK